MKQPDIEERSWLGSEPTTSLTKESTGVETIVLGDDDDSITLRQIWSVIRYRLPAILAVIAGVTSLSYFWMLNQEERYQNSFELLIGEPTEEASSANDLLLGAFISSIDYETQIKVLTSRFVMEPVIADIQQKYPEVDYESLIDDGRFVVEQIENSKILLISYEHEDPEQIKFVLDQFADGYLNYSLQDRQLEIQQGLDFVKAQLPQLRARVDGLQSELQQFREGSNLLDPEAQAGQLSNELLTLERQLFETQVERQAAQTNFELLRSQLDLAPEEAIASSYLSESPRYQNLLNELQKIELELAERSTIFKAGSPNIQSLEEQRDNLLPLLRQEADVLLGEDLPAVQQPALASPSELRLKLNQEYIEAANQIQILQRREAALTTATNQLNQQVQQLPDLARRFTDLQQTLSIATENLQRFLSAEQQLELDLAKRGQRWQIISPPLLPENPVYPRPIRSLALGITGGAVLGLAAAFILERLDPVFHSTEEVADATALPILGYIPVHKSGDGGVLGSVSAKKLSLPGLMTRNQDDVSEESFIMADIEGTLNGNGSHKNARYRSSLFLESFRSLNTNIRLLGSETRTNTFVVTSVDPAEGKSTVALNLAIAAAEMGQRVLLVDTDLRRPVLHRRFGLENEAGLTNLIAEGLLTEEVVQRVEGKDNLFILTAGNIPPDPSRLLSSQRMRQLMESLRSRGVYDMIIYDTPPVYGFADARLLAPHTNGAVLVVKINKTERASFRRVIEQAKISRVNLLGLVINGVKHSGDNYYYYRYYNQHNRTF
ncbi:MAG: polysaccharide biosynthesis tyrosine autokinase [Cyanobacteria bacterium P01_H01_bin.15]